MDKKEIGSNAGLVWQTLNSLKRKVSWDELRYTTKLSSINLAFAIGWLAREDKIAITTIGNNNVFEIL